MSGDAQVTGQIRIDPPVTWGEVVDCPWALTEGGNHGYPDAVLELSTTVENTPTGEVRHHSGVAIEPAPWEQSARTLTEDVGRIVRQFATAPDGTVRTFTGFLHVVWGHGESIYRVHVVAGEAVEAHPQMTWPVGARDEDAVGSEEGAP